MDQKIKGLFDYQIFAQNDRLNGLIRAAENALEPEELALDDLELVNAAGNIDSRIKMETDLRLQNRERNNEV